MLPGVSLVLKKAGLKITPTRKLVLGVFSTDCEPINAEFICNKLKSKDINLVTIYRNLSSFERSGIIARVDLRKESVYYELSNHHHHHVVCTKCGRTEGFEDCNVETISRNVLRRFPLFDTISQHSLELFGLCRPCSGG